MERFTRITFIASLVGFLASAGIHVCTLLGINVQRFQLSPFLLHGLALVTFGASFMIAGIKFSRIPLADRPQNLLRSVVSRTPKWMLVFISGLIIYGGLNFFVALPAGSPDYHDGKYTLQNHGTVLREISEAEYNAAQRGEIRGFSGHWMIFFCAAVLFCLPRFDANSRTETPEA